jgi:predicted dehydrogenase
MQFMHLTGSFIMSETQPNQSLVPPSDQQKIRYAVVGLGWFSQSAALPAFAQTENAELVALVSDDSEKLSTLAQRYDVERTCTYEEYDDLLASGEVDAVYIGLPNHLHCDYTVRAAKAGIHVLCEKPMAVTVDECETMNQAARENNIKLMIAYRLHLEEANLQAIEVIRSGQIGEPRIFSSVFSQQVEEGNTRVNRGVGGGTLDDVGIYCINAARYIFQDEPTEVFATAASNGEERFKEVAEMTTAIMRFPGSANPHAERLASFTCSFGAAKVSNYQVLGTKGDLRVEPAYSTQGGIKHTLTLEGDKQEQTFGSHDQIAAEFDYFANCILNNQDPEPSGIEGQIDVQIIQALYRSQETGRFERVEFSQHPSQRPGANQIVNRPPAPEKAELVKVADPAGNT